MPPHKKKNTKPPHKEKSSHIDICFNFHGGGGGVAQAPTLANQLQQSKHVQNHVLNSRIFVI